MIGKTISHYKILEKLGEGGMGVVYKAEDSKLDRAVALKFLPPALATQDEVKKRFIHEAKAASSLDHPNICAIFEIDETPEGQMFIAMPHYAGETLQAKIARGPVQVDEAIDIVLQVAAGLAKAHDEGIVHRDIKPGNILITMDGLIKIVDFGLATFTTQTRLTKTGTTVGTVAYMSPEQAVGEAVDYRTDIWALGICLYEMITGRLPFDSKYEQALIYCIVNKDIEPLGSYADERPGIVNIVTKALKKDVEERYQSVAAFVADLENLDQVSAGPARAERQSKADDKVRIAVLPLVNISPDPSDEFFADGMTEELISCLSKIRDLGVIARTSVMQYKGASKSVDEIGRELKVGAILEGSVRKAANTLRITIQLVDVQSQEHLWSEDYDREFKDVFVIQSDVASCVAKAMELQFLDKEKQQVETAAPDDLEAYTLVLQGNMHLNRRTRKDFETGRDYFQQAVAKDPGYAVAYVGLAECFSYLTNYGLSSPADTYTQAKDAVNKALELNPNLADAYACKGLIVWQYEKNWPEAEKVLLHALELNPNSVTARFYYSLVLVTWGEFDKAHEELELAQELDPLSTIIKAIEGWIFCFGGEYDRAIRVLDPVLEADPNHFATLLSLGLSNMKLGRMKHAIAFLERARTATGAMSRVLAYLGHVYGAAGRESDANRVLEELQQRSKQEYVSPYFIALVYGGLGEKDKAFEYLDKAIGERDSMVRDLKIDPPWDSLRSDPRYAELLGKMAL